MQVVGILLALYARHQTGRGSMSMWPISTPPLRSWRRHRSCNMSSQMALSRNADTAPTRGNTPSIPHTRRKMRSSCRWDAPSPGCGKICQALERRNLPYCRRPEHLWRAPNAEETAVRNALQTIFRQRTRAAWVAFLGDKNVCIGPVNTIAEVFADPQVQHRQMLLEHHSDTLGRVRQAGIALKLSDTPDTSTAAWPDTRAAHRHGSRCAWVWSRTLHGCAAVG